MLKKSAALSSAVFLLATGLTTLAISSASATTPITDVSITLTGAPLSGEPTTTISVSNSNFLTSQWTVSGVTWSPTVSGGSFAANTVYTETFTATAEPNYVFASWSTNAFTLTGAGATGATVSNTATSAGATSAGATSTVVTIVYPNSGNGGSNNSNNSNNLNNSNNSNNSNNLPPTVSTATASNITDTSFSVDFATLAAAHSSVSTWDVELISIDTSHTILQTNHVAGSLHSTSFTGLTAGTSYYAFMAVPTQPLVNGRETGCEPGLTVTTTGGSSNNSSNTSQQSTQIAAAQAAAKAEAARQAARSTLTTLVSANKPVQTSDFQAAGITVASTNALSRVTTDLANLPAAQRADISAIAKVVAIENFVDKVSTPTTHKQVTSVDLVQQGLVDPSNPNKASIILALQKANPSTLNSVSAIQATIKAAMDAIAARKARTAAIIAKIEGHTANK